MVVTTRHTNITLIIILLLAAALRFAFSPSISGNDDLAIARCALNLLRDGMSVPTGHYCARFGMTLPLAGIFAVAGTGVTQISLLPAITSMASVFIAWRVARQLFGTTEGLVAAAAMALFPLAIEYAGLMFPDAPQGALLAGAMLCLLAARESRRGWLLAISSGALWAWAYYIKIDAAALVFVIAIGWMLGQMRFFHCLVAGISAFVLVGIELAAYGVLVGDPLLRLHLDSIAANEVLGVGKDYRSLITYPKAMFLVPYQAGIHYYVWLIGIVAAVWTRSRPALLIAGWSMLWLAYLAFAVDPFSEFRLKPQLARYLLSFAIPVMVLIGWLMVLMWRRIPILATGTAAVALACAALFGPFNLLSYEAAQATRIAVAAAQRERWFPLCPDVQSATIVNFLLEGQPENRTPCVVQTHDFLQGVTAFAPPPSLPAYLLINSNFTRRLEGRSLVSPLTHTAFDAQTQQVLRIDNPLPRASYLALDVLLNASRFLPMPALRASITNTSAELSRDGDAMIWRLTPKPTAGSPAIRQP